MNIICPICKKELIKDEKTYHCPDGHSFDIARQGYINLNMHKSVNTGDNKLMVDARSEFLNNDHYDFLRKEIDKLINPEDTLIDLACGQGYYTAYFKARNKIGIDLSKTALKKASASDKTTTYILSSIFHTPLKEKCADKVITIFAPVADEEIRRILKDDGKFILVRPDESHLLELKKAIYDKPYLNDTKPKDYEGLKLQESISLKNEEVLNKNDIGALFMMTPYFNTTSKVDKMKLDNIDNLLITFSFIIDIYTKETS